MHFVDIGLSVGQSLISFWCLQVVMAIMGFYVSLYFVSKALSGGKKDAVQAAAPAVSVNAGDVPSIESPEFDAWISTPGNLEKLLQE